MLKAEKSCGNFQGRCSRFIFLSLIPFQISSLYLLLFDARYLSTAISALFGEGGKPLWIIFKIFLL